MPTPNPANADLANRIRDIADELPGLVERGTLVRLMLITYAAQLELIADSLDGGELDKQETGNAGK